MSNENEKRILVRSEDTEEEDFMRALREKVAAHLKECSQKPRSLTNQELARRLNITVSRLNHLKRGDGDLSPYILANLAKFLRVTIDDLVMVKDLTDENLISQSTTAEIERAAFIQNQTSVVQVILARQDAVRSATAELGKAMVETLEKRAAEIKKIIEDQQSNHIVPVAPNQISMAEIVDLERASLEVWVSTSQDLPYLGRGVNLSRDFIDIEAEGINKGRKYRYFVGGIIEEEEEATRLGFMDLIWNEGQGSVDKEQFKKNFDENVEIIFSGDPHRPVFSWALHKLESKKNINPWLQLKYGGYIHEVSFDGSDGTSIGYGKWIGHMCFSLPGEKIFILMHKEMLTRAHRYFGSEMASRGTSENSSTAPGRKARPYASRKE